MDPWAPNKKAGVSRAVLTDFMGGDEAAKVRQSPFQGILANQWILSDTNLSLKPFCY